MASHLDAAEEPTDSASESLPEPDNRIDEHLQSALAASDDDGARYHLREALQLQLAERNGLSIE